MQYEIYWPDEVLAELDQKAAATRFYDQVMRQIVVIVELVQATGEHHANEKKEGHFRFDLPRIRLTMAYRDADTFEVDSWAIIK